MFLGLHLLLIVLSIVFCVVAALDINNDIQHGFFFLLLGTLWAALEVQIEGKNGWAAKIPTTSFFGSHFTWYHVIMNLMIFVLVFQVISFSWALPFWLASLFFIEDYMWFMINPEYGVSKYSAENIPWHPWVLYMPIGNWISIMIMVISSVLQFVQKNEHTLFIMIGVVIGYLLFATLCNLLMQCIYRKTTHTRLQNNKINF